MVMVVTKVMVTMVMVVTKVLVVADRGEEGTGWAAIDDFEFLYDVFEVRILYISSSGCQINFMHFNPI